MTYVIVLYNLLISDHELCPCVVKHSHYGKFENDGPNVFQVAFAHEYLISGHFSRELHQMKLPQLTDLRNVMQSTSEL